MEWEKVRRIVVIVTIGVLLLLLGKLELEDWQKSPFLPHNGYKHSTHKP